MLSDHSLGAASSFCVAFFFLYYTLWVIVVVRGRKKKLKASTSLIVTRSLLYAVVSPSRTKIAPFDVTFPMNTLVSLFLR